MRLDIAHLYMYAKSKSLLLLDVCDALFGEDQIFVTEGVSRISGRWFSTIKYISYIFLFLACINGIIC